MDQDIQKSEVYHMSAESKVEIAQFSSDRKWMLVQCNGSYFFSDNRGSAPDLIRTPGGTRVSTIYRQLADRLLLDLQAYGTDASAPASLLPWHYSLIDLFSRMEHEQVEAILESGFLSCSDWTLEGGEVSALYPAFGTAPERIDEIRAWIRKCTPMQLTAAACIGNSYHSINLAFVLAHLMENYRDADLDSRFVALAQLLAEHNADYAPAEKLLQDFQNFRLYYGIHLEENRA